MNSCNQIIVLYRDTKVLRIDFKIIILILSFVLKNIKFQKLLLINTFSN